MTTYFYLKYAVALLMVNNQLTKESQIKTSHIEDEIMSGLGHFAINPGRETKKGTIYIDSKDKKEGGFFTPNFTDQKLKKVLEEILQSLKSRKLNLSSNSDKIKKSVIPTFGEYISFSSSGINDRAKPKGTNWELCLGCITSSTPDKPCFRENGQNWFLIPDFEDLDDMKAFIKLFKRMRDTRTKNLKIGFRKQGYKKAFAPELLHGNFPNPPQKAVMGPIALLGAIGEMEKDKEVSALAHNVIEKLKDTCIYIISVKEIHVFFFNHVIIDMASKGKLCSIINGISHAKLYNNEKAESEKYNLFTSRFLQMFNKTSFREFLSVRAEYPIEIKNLLITYFCKMEKNEKEVVESAVKLGQFLNKAAFISAMNDSGHKNWADLEKGDKEKVAQNKNKILISLESSIISAKTGDELLKRISLLIGRLCNISICKEAELFMKEIVEGGLTIERAKNLLLAFSRLENSEEK